MSKIGFTGSRNGMSKIQKDKLKNILKEYEDFEFHHGDCVGADADSHKMAREFGGFIIIHPSKNSILQAYCDGDKRLPKEDYLKRNQNIVDLTDFLIAAPEKPVDIVRSGTWSTIRYAKKQKKEVFIL